MASSVGFVVLLMVWWSGPGVFAGGRDADERVVSATVVQPVSCTTPNPLETVRFSVGPDQRDAALDGCGHSRGERLEIAVPVKIKPGPLTVRLAQTQEGHHQLRRPIGLLLVALSCVGGGFYAFLVSRRPLPRRAMHA